MHRVLGESQREGKWDGALEEDSYLFSLGKETPPEMTLRGGTPVKEEAIRLINTPNREFEEDTCNVPL